MSVKDIIQSNAAEIVQNTKIAAVTSAATTTSGVATYLEWIPANIGWIATLAGFFLSVTLCYTHIQKNKRAKEQEVRNKEKHDLEMEILRQKLDEAKNGNSDG